MCGGDSANNLKISEVMEYMRKEFTLDRIVRLAIGLAVIGAALWLLNYL